MGSLPPLVVTSIIVVAVIACLLIIFTIGRVLWLNSRLFQPPRFIDEKKSDTKTSWFDIPKKWLGLTSQVSCRLVKASQNENIAERKLVIYSYGSDENVHTSSEKVDTLVTKVNVDYISYDYPGYDGSGKRAIRDISSHSFDASLKAVVRAMLDKGYQQTNIFLHGFSMGSGPSTAVAAHFSQARQSLGGLILESAFVSIRQGIRDIMAPLLAYTVPDRWNNQRAISKVKSKILILHGEEDSKVLPKNADKLKEANQASTLVKFPSQGHYIEPNESGAIIKKWLAGEPLNNSLSGVPSES